MSAIIKRHAGVLGLCSYVDAHPYDVPDVLPEVLMLLSDHVNDPPPIQVIVSGASIQYKMFICQ